MPDRVVVTGMGIVSALGFGVEENKRALLNGKSGIGSGQFLQTHHSKLPVGQVKISSSELLGRLQPKLENAWNRTSLLALAALREASSDGEWGAEMRRETGLISATTVGGMDRTENFYGGFLKDPMFGHLREVVHHDCGASTELLAEELGIGGYHTTINTACSSSVNAVMLGARLISSGRLKKVFVGGADGLSRFTLNGFNALMILSDEACRPFDAERKGLNLGEGAAYLMLESESSANGRDAEIYGVVSGFANSNDAFHQTASSPEGTGAQLAMRGALEMAGLKASDISAINAHGTATPNNDLAEGQAIVAVFGDNLPAVSSTKGYTGHTLGAAGSVESVFSLLSLNTQKIFSNLGWQSQMPEVPLKPVIETMDIEIEHILSNSFGFGGNCSSVIYSRA